METYIFTFGCGQELEGFYVKVNGKNYDDCRQKMCEKFGDNWSFQYSLENWNKWVNEANKKGIFLEEEIFVIN